MDALTAIKSATYNTARQIKIDNLGAIAPGYVADMLLMDSLSELRPSKVYYEGTLVSENGTLVVPISEKEFEIETRNSVQLVSPKLEQFIYTTPEDGEYAKVNVMVYGDVTAHTITQTEEIPIVDRHLDISHDKDLKYVIVFNRHGKGTIGYGVMRGFGTHSGAIASTVSHDSHNLIVVYDTPENGKIAVDALINIGGGMSVVLDGELQATLPLQVGGLMSTSPAEVVAEQAQKMKEVMQKIGLDKLHNPLLRIVVCALPVIPDCKMSDLGLVDVLNKKIIPLYV